MKKSEVYSWRVAPATKVALELEARREGESLATLLDRIAQEWLRSRQRAAGSEDAEQARLHATASTVFGTIAGADRRRAERTRRIVRERLARSTLPGPSSGPARSPSRRSQTAISPS